LNPTTFKKAAGGSKPRIKAYKSSLIYFHEGQVKPLPGPKVEYLIPEEALIDFVCSIRFRKVRLRAMAKMGLAA
jgi:hypothetical protein